MDKPKYGTKEWEDWKQEQREALESRVGQTWNTEELTSDFTIDSFLAPFCFGTRKSDGKKVSIQFQHSPRFYFNVKER